MNVEAATGKAAPSWGWSPGPSERKRGFWELRVSPGALLNAAVGAGELQDFSAFWKFLPVAASPYCLSRKMCPPRCGLWLLDPLWSEPKLLGWGRGCCSRTSLGKHKFTKHTSATYVSDVPNLLRVLCWVSRLNCDASARFEGPERCSQPGVGGC